MNTNDISFALQTKYGKSIIQTTLSNEIAYIEINKCINGIINNVVLFFNKVRINKQIIIFMNNNEIVAKVLAKDIEQFKV